MLRAGKLVDRGKPGELLTRYGRQNMEEVFIDIARELVSISGSTARGQMNDLLLPQSGPLHRCDASAAPVRRHRRSLSGSGPLDSRTGVLADDADGAMGVLLRYFWSVTVRGWRRPGVLISGVLLWDVLPGRRPGIAGVHGGDVVAQSRPFVREPVAADGTGRRAAGDEPYPHVHRRRRRGVDCDLGFISQSFDLGLPLLCPSPTSSSWAGPSACWCPARAALRPAPRAWRIAIFAVQPISGVYYPIEVLPGWLQIVAHGLPLVTCSRAYALGAVLSSFRVDLLGERDGAGMSLILPAASPFLAFFTSQRARAVAARDYAS